MYRARGTRLGRDVAVKILPKEMSTDSARKQRFEREEKTISSLNHPNICTLHDIGSQDGVGYLVNGMCGGRDAGEAARERTLAVGTGAEVRGADREPGA